MKNLTKIGRVGALNLRTIKQNEAIAVSFGLDGVKFDETFAADDLRLKNGDLIYAEYESDGA